MNSRAQADPALDDEDDDTPEEESDVDQPLAEEELNDPELQPLLEGQGETAARQDFDASSAGCAWNWKSRTCGGDDAVVTGQGILPVGWFMFGRAGIPYVRA